MLKRSWTVCWFLPCLLTGTSAISAECNGRIFEIDDLNRSTEFYPLFVQSRNGTNFAVLGNCANLYARSFVGTITFFVRNQFRNYESVPVGILRIKSVKTFLKDVGPRIKVSRHAGWYLPADGDAGSAKQSGRLSDSELKLTPSEWTDAHANSDDVLQLNKKIGSAWHAYASADRTLSSADTRGYWNFPDSGDRKRQTLTNYLIRFDTAKSGENIEWYAEVPNGVERIDVSIDSNLEILNSDYTFYITR